MGEANVAWGHILNPLSEYQHVVIKAPGAVV